MERRQQIRTALRYLTAFGNENILWSHIVTLEEDILNRGENKSYDFTNTPHFAAWIRLCSEYFANSLFHNYFRMCQDEKVYDYSFDKIIKLIRSEHEKNPSFLKKKNLSLSDIIDIVYRFPPVIEKKKN